jgi:hypothetical protein
MNYEYIGYLIVHADLNHKQTRKLILPRHVLTRYKLALPYPKSAGHKPQPSDTIRQNYC